MKPNFFIVGAPKCGTTAMNDYLARHPDIFMAKKEIHYFGSDLRVRHRITEAAYLSLFKGTTSEKIVGEASVWYLYSNRAAKEIKEFSPSAKILIMLRNPVEVIHSMHSQHIFDGNEDVTDFETAISLDEQRKQGRQLPAAVDFFELPPYIDAVAYSEQVKRYLDVFGTENVKVLLYEDFARDTPGAVKQVLQFLGLDTPMTGHYEVINSNKQVRSFILHRLIKMPAPALKKIARIVMPSKALRHAIMLFFFKRNLVSAKREAMSDNVRAQLQKQTSPDIERLSRLIHKDLSAWQ